MIVKVCGMGNTAIMHQLALLPVDMLGFIFYPRSPRYVEGKIDPEELLNLPDEIQKVGVFVNASEESVLESAQKFHLDAIQLHGSETPQLCKTLQTKGYLIIKAFNLARNNNYSDYEPYCSYFLFDTPSEQHGGTGEKFDWTLLESYQGDTPFLLSGGIGPNDVNELLQINHPKLAGIDINSKFEISPGVKSYSSISKFLDQLKQ